jgi:serine/threonine protein kinase
MPALALRAKANRFFQLGWSMSNSPEAVTEPVIHDDSLWETPDTEAPPELPASPGGNRGGNPLPIGQTVQEYVIEGLVGEGGFGIVYLARDTQLDRVVALKEYMPSALAMRGINGHVTLRSQAELGTFELGRRSFVNEAQLLAAFDQPSLVKVYRFWEQNGTAYMVMPYYEGPTLRQWVKKNGAPPEAWLRGMLLPLMDALETMHTQRCYHRDIAPDNILLLKSGTDIPRPLLLDFGAARRVIGDNSQILTVILKPGYAPIEQYSQSASMKQGPWTDIYALCAVLYAAISGKAPEASAARIVTDEMPPAVQIGQGRYTHAFLNVIDQGLAVRPDQRPQSMAALKLLFEAATLNMATPAPIHTPPTAAPPLPERQWPVTAPEALHTEPEPYFGQRPMPQASLRPPESPADGSSYLAWIGSAVVTSVFIGSLAVWLLPTSKPKPLKIESSTATAPDPRAEAPSQPSTALPFAPVAVLQDLVAHANPALQVQARAERVNLSIGRDRMSFRVKASEAGYVYVYLSGTDKSRFHLLFPNSLDQNNRITADQEMLLPRRNWRVNAGGPAGTNHLAVLVSKVPRDFSQLPFLPKTEDIPELDWARFEPMWLTRNPAEPPLSGKARCTDSAQPCDSSYGATLIEIFEHERGLQRKTPKRVKRFSKAEPGDDSSMDSDTDTDSGPPSNIPDPDTEIRTHVQIYTPSPAPSPPTPLPQAGEGS